MKHLLLPLGALALRAYGMSYHMGCPATPQVGGEGCKRELQGVVRSYRDKRHNREAPRSNSNFLVSMDWFQEPLQVPKSIDVCFLHEMVDIKGPVCLLPEFWSSQGRCQKWVESFQCPQLHLPSDGNHMSRPDWEVPSWALSLRLGEKTKVSLFWAIDKEYIFIQQQIPGNISLLPFEIYRLKIHSCLNTFTSLTTLHENISSHDFSNSIYFIYIQILC